MPVDTVDNLMRGMKITLSFSCPSAMLQAVEEYRMLNFLNTSQAVTKLIRLGITYTQLLAEQRRLKEAEKVVKPKKKKPKRKTPSKTK